MRVSSRRDNPARRPRGRKAVELALEGNALTLKLCLDRLSAPRRERAVAFTLPAIGSAEDLAGAMATIAAAAAAGELTPGEAFDMAGVADSFLRIIGARRGAAGGSHAPLTRQVRGPG